MCAHAVRELYGESNENGDLFASVDGGIATRVFRVGLASSIMGWWVKKLEVGVSRLWTAADRSVAQRKLLPFASARGVAVV